MKITYEKSLRDFPFWSSAFINACKLTPDQLDEIESILKEIYPNGINETELNNLFWFDFDSVCAWLGLDKDFNL